MKVFPAASPRRNTLALLLSAIALVSILLLPWSSGGWEDRSGGSLAQPPDLGKLSLLFEPNAGQTDPSVRFVAHTSGGTLFFTPSEVVMSLENRGQGPGGRDEGLEDSGVVVSLSFVGADPGVQIESDGALPGKVNYLLGNDPNRWATDIPTFSRITYNGIYPGVDLTYEGDARQLKGTYIVAPGGDAGLIRWRYVGASDVRVDEGGNLKMSLAGGELDALTEQAPTAWQEVNGRRVPVAASYILGGGGEIRFNLGSYNPALPLTIDPALTYSTYLGGNFAENGYGIAADTAGNFYVAGSTNSSNFPRVNAFQNSFGGSEDAFVAKFNPAGQPVYITYLGGSTLDRGYDIAADADGNAYITGFTASSANFPIANAYQPAYGGGLYDAFVTKLNPAGSMLVFSTYLGGSNAENSQGSGPQSGSIAIDSDRNVYVTGYTQSDNFPVRNAFQPTRRGAADLFITKFNPAGSDLVWSTYLGGTSQDQAKGIAVDGTGNVSVVGHTYSTDYPTLAAFQATLRGTSDGFVTRINATGAALIYSTYLGGTGSEEARDVASDSAGNAYVTGYTDSGNFPLVNPLQSYGGFGDAFVTKFGPTGVPAYSTYLGGPSSEDGFSIAANEAGEAFVLGSTQSQNFPTAEPIFPSLRGSEDAFVTRFAATGTRLLFSTYFGGTDNREVQARGAIAVDASNTIYFTGSTGSSDYPTTANAYQPFRASATDAFVSRISENAPTPTATPPGGNPSPTPNTCILGDYTIAQSTGATIVPGTALLPNSACNDCTAPMVLPFPVQFYDQTFTQARASSNGNLQFTSDNSLPFNSCLPNPQYDNVIYGYWDDLFLDCNAGFGCGIYTSVSGTAPNRIFNIEWRAHRNEPPVVNVKFEIRLYENGNGRFDIIYGQVDNPGDTATIGVQRDTGSRFTQYACNTGTLSQGLQLTFTLAPCQTATIVPTAVTPLPTATATPPPPAPPDLLYSTYFGSFERDIIEDIATDAAGNIYVMGTTFQDDINYGSILVAKFSPNGQTLLYQTLLGGTRIDYGYGLAVDPAGNAIVSGITTSNDYPTLNALQPNHAGGVYDTVLTKLNPAGNIVFSTYLGGNATDYAERVTLDVVGNIYLTGHTASTNFPTTPGSYQPSNGGSTDGYVTKMNPIGSAIIWSTYLGGTNTDASHAIALDGQGNVYLTGFTGSPNFPLMNPFQPAMGDGGDAFVTKMNSTGTALVYSTFLGGGNPPGPGEDNGQGIAVDPAGYAYVTGFTQSPNFPTTPGSFQPFFRGYYDAFVTKFGLDGTSLVYSTFLGGSLEPPFGDDEAFDIAVDGAGQAHITGKTYSPDFPVASAIQPMPNDVYEAFVTKFNSAGSGLIYSTYLGGDYDLPEHGGNDVGLGILIDSAGNALIGGGTGGFNFPVVNPYQAQSQGYGEGFISRIAGSNPPPTALPQATMTPGMTVTAQATTTPQISVTPQTSITPQTTTTVQASTTPQATITAQATLTPQMTATPPNSVTPQATITPQTSMTAQVTGTATNIPGQATSTPMQATPTAPASTHTPVACQLTFSDVPPNSTFYPFVRCLACRGILGGYSDGTFRPNNDITRGQIAKVVSNAAGINDADGEQIYEDVDASNPFYVWVNRLSRRGYMGGYPCGLTPGEPCKAPDNRPYFRPFASATRGQLAKIVASAGGITGSPTGQRYADVPPDSTFYVWIEQLSALGVMGGYPCGGAGEPCGSDDSPYFRPTNNVTRGQASKIVANTFFPGCQTP